jgi:carbonic anhydrase/acetyltransferase-like protein (isoleucine patch superfamily)
VDPTAVVIGAVTVDAGVEIGPAVVLRADTAPIRIGLNSTVAEAAVVHGGLSGASVGAACAIGARAYPGGCILEDEVVIEPRALILDGARVSRGARIAMGALVPGSMEVPAHSHVTGIPAELAAVTAGD